MITEIANFIVRKAMKAGCKALITTITTNGDIDVTRSLSVMLSYGFKFKQSTDMMILLEKELK